jgi:hypothetical protein
MNTESPPYPQLFAVDQNLSIRSRECGFRTFQPVTSGRRFGASDYSTAI